ncbi:MAG: AraC family transcriptional regulator [Methylococcales bacterium]|nr:MAG: AraC family transcriptional regulator [Methylococcales bacterium]
MAYQQQNNVKRWSINNNELPLQFQHKYDRFQQSLPENLGQGFTNIFQLDHHLSFMETDYRPSKDLSILNKIDSDEPRLIITLSLKGNSCFSSNQGNTIFFKEGYTTIAAYHSSSGERHYQANKAIMQLRLSLNQKCVERYFGTANLMPLFNKSGIQQISCLPISHQGLIIAQQLLNNQFPQEGRRLFMQGQVMSLLATELMHLWIKPTEHLERFSQKDREIAMEAQDILFLEFKTPPSVEVLAKRVGINQLKLKTLFHHYFNNTPYGLLLEIRMRKAYQLLASNRYHVSVVADIVGYNHSSNFSAAFIKYFGLAPKQVSKRTNH